MEFTNSGVKSFENMNGEDSTNFKGPKLAPFNPTSNDVIDVAFSSNMLNLSSDDILYDLGCGDGRVMIKACQLCPGIKCVGVEYDSKLVHAAQNKIKELINHKESKASP